MKLSIVIPAHNEEGSIGSTLLGLAGLLETEEIDYELLVVDDASTDRTAEIVKSLIEANAHIRYHRSHSPPGFGFAVRSGLDEFTGDAVAIVMADGSDQPEDLLRYYRLHEEGYDCLFGSRFIRGSSVHDYPRFKLVLTGSQTSASGCSSGTATTTRRMLSRRTGGKWSRRSSPSSPTTSTSPWSCR